MHVLLSAALPIFEQNKYIVDIEYSPLVAGFAVVLNDGRAAVLTASSLKFDPNVSAVLYFYINDPLTSIITIYERYYGVFLSKFKEYGLRILKMQLVVPLTTDTD